MSEADMCRMRMWQVLKYTAGFTLFGICYGIWVRQTGLAVPCLFHVITGFKCPGCGMTRMCVALLRLDFAGAFHYNQVLFFLMPVLGSIFLADTAAYVKTGRWSVGRVQSYILYVSIAVLIVFGVIRNIVPL